MISSTPRAAVALLVLLLSGLIAGAAAEERELFRGEQVPPPTTGCMFKRNAT